MRWRSDRRDFVCERTESRIWTPDVRDSTSEYSLSFRLDCCFRMEKNSVKIPAWKDQFPLAATIYTPIGHRYDTVVLINAALGIAQSSYSRFAMSPQSL